MKKKGAASSSNSKVATKRILLVDDHPIMRHGLAQLIRAAEELEVCGEAGSAREGLEQTLALKPDLVIVDLTLPDKSGLELLKDINAMSPGMQCLVLSMHDESLYAERVLRSGARGYIMKETAAENLITAIRKVLSGGLYLSDSLAAKMLEQAAFGRPKLPGGGVDALTDRELEVLEAIGSGKATKIIAEQLNISARTVEAHRAHIKEKLNITDGPGLVRYAVQWMETRAGLG
ncbi:MAG: response regulator transcription factor [Verrucomicrobiales bacterium]|nr:response regulator transcription factor [Verrucomicrobiales bacterium]MCP5557442.1 response regulator transcription factor [Verrucomicrobiaceae bacterium]